MTPFGRIYAIRNKTNNKKYIGQTITSIEQRWSVHVATSKTGKTPLARAIQKYGSEGFEIVEVAQCEDRASLDAEEKFWIEFGEALVPNGYNLMGGGQQGRGPWTPEALLNLSEAQKASYARNPERAKDQSERFKKLWAAPKHREELSLKHKSWWTPEQRKIQSERKAGFTPSPEVRALANEARRKPIRVTGPDGAVREFPSSQHACEELKLTASAVSQCLRGRRTHHKGFVFERVSPVTNL